MSRFAEPMARLIEELKKLPGVGGKTAQRFAFHILRASDEDAELLADAIREVKASLRLCSICNNITDVDPCTYCTSATRNLRLVCVVEEPTNIAAIEKTRHYNGVYHVLHGALSPLHGVGPEQLRIGNLVKRVEAGERRRADPGDQSHGRRRSHGDLSFAVVQVGGGEGDAHCHRRSRRQRHRVRRRGHHAEGDGGAEGTVGRRSSLFAIRFSLTTAGNVQHQESSFFAVPACSFAK